MSGEGLVVPLPPGLVVPRGSSYRILFSVEYRNIFRARCFMETFFMYGRYSPAAIKGISAGRTSRANSIVRKHKGVVKSIYALLGEHDLVIIATFPGVEQAMAASIALGKTTGIGFNTSVAVPVERFDKLAARA